MGVVGVRKGREEVGGRHLGARGLGGRQNCGYAARKWDVGLGIQTPSLVSANILKSALLGTVPPILVPQIQVHPLGLMLCYPE